MSEIAKYDAYKKKLQGICDENDLVYRFRNDTYPITLTIQPVNGIEAQMQMMEFADTKGYTSPDASIVFAFKDGGLTYKMSETFTISDALFSKIKNLSKNLHYCWLQFFFREITEKNILPKEKMPTADEGTKEAEDNECEEVSLDDLDGAVIYTTDDDLSVPDGEEPPSGYEYDAGEVTNGTEGL